MQALETFFSGGGWAAEGNEACRGMAGVCRRSYGGAALGGGFHGVSGDFTPEQLNRVVECLGEGSVAYMEPDGVVYKAEGPPQVPEDPILGALWKVQQKSFGEQDGAAAAPAPAAAAGAGEGAGARGETPRAAAEAEALRGLASGSREDAGLLPPGASALRVRAFGPQEEEGKRQQNLHSALWNLDRIDQRSLPLDGQFTYSESDGGRGVTVYVVDSGLYRDHKEFAPWESGPTRAHWGYDFVDDDDEPEDCDGHGTHIASTAVGRTVGVAKEAHVVGVRVLDCAGSGSISDVVAALDWVSRNRIPGPAVVTLSLGVSLGQWSRSLEDSVRSLVRDQGVMVVVASGNSAVDSCFVAPGNVEETLTVAASDLVTKFSSSDVQAAASGSREGLYRWSNTGSCVDLFAPGVDIYAACGGSGRCQGHVTPSSYAWASGTSMAVPLVAGVAANYLASHPGAAPDHVKQVILEGATEGRLESPHLMPGSPNRVLYSKLLDGTAGAEPSLSTREFLGGG